MIPVISDAIGTSTTIARNVATIRDRIAAAAERSGRTADDIRLVAVTKYVDAETTADVVRAGCSIIGESRPQVLVQKHEALSSIGDLPSVSWHLIGHLQRNKVAR
ncbi:MAG: YggS family pyridoxal phosphate-dependent enzyme, partial [Planctomycetota bacterium]